MSGTSSSSGSEGSGQQMTRFSVDEGKETDGLSGNYKCKMDTENSRKSFRTSLRSPKNNVCVANVCACVVVQSDVTFGKCAQFKTTRWACFTCQYTYSKEKRIRKAFFLSHHLPTISDLLKELLDGGAAERGGPYNHLVQNDSHRPPVHSVAVSLAQDDLGGYVVWRTIHLRIMELVFV